jgi:ATP-dependent protease HslVU (ClpYQ) peptidase subunit
MSIVACRILEDGYEIAADSITVRGSTQTKNNINRSKLVEVNGMVIGSVGSAEESSLLQLFAKTHHPSTATEEGLLEFWNEFSEWKQKRTDRGNIDNRYFIGLEGVVFYVEHWLIASVSSYEAIGAGMDFALAALHLGHTAEEAVATAIELSIYCEPPIQVIKKKHKKEKK